MGAAADDCVAVAADGIAFGMAVVGGDGNADIRAAGRIVEEVGAGASDKHVYGVSPGVPAAIEGAAGVTTEEGVDASCGSES